MNRFYMPVGIVVVTIIAVTLANRPQLEINTRVDKNIDKPRSPALLVKPVSNTVDHTSGGISKRAEQHTITKTNPAFRLLGVTLSTAGNTAIIAINDFPEKIVYEGGYCIEDWKLIKVLNNKVIVSSGQQTLNIPLSSRDTRLAESLPIKNLTDKEITNLDRYIDAELVIKAAQQRMQDSEFRKKMDIYIDGRQLAEVPYPMGVTSYGVTKISDNRYQIERDAIAEQVMQSHIYLHTEFSFEKDQLVLDRIVPGSLFDKAGMLPDDRVLAINNQPLLAKTNPLQLYQQLLYSEQRLNVKLVRDGDEMEITYIIK